MQNNWALITGATSGIGKATAEKLAAQGCNLIITGRREDRLFKLKEELLSHKIDVLALCFDVQNKKQISDIFQANKSHIDKVNILINNAGLARGVAPIDEGEIDDWDQMIDTNIKGLLYMTRFMLPSLKRHGQGDIINIGSVSGRWTYPGGAVYCGTKHAVRAITEGMRQDLAGTNIRVSCIEPGLVDTEFSLVRLEDDTKAKKVYADTRALTADDIADTIIWSLSRPAHVNIQELVVFPTDQAAITQVHRTS